MTTMLTGILLAAGQSRRFGADKLLQPLPDGLPVAVAAARHLVAALPDALAVVDSRNTVLNQQLEAEGLRIAVNPDAEAGMGTSLACGVRASRHADGWVVALADMPFIASRTIAAVAAAIATPRAIAAPRYRGLRGHPVGFGMRYAPDLLALHGDAGARHVLATHRHDLRLIDCEDAGVVTDIDYPHDLDGVTGQS